MDAESQRILEYLTEVEEAAEDVLTTKQQVNKHLLTTVAVFLICKLRRSEMTSESHVERVLAAKLTSSSELSAKQKFGSKIKKG